MGETKAINIKEFKFFTEMGVRDCAEFNRHHGFRLS